MRVNLRQRAVTNKRKSFPGGPVGKESACNAGDAEDSGSIPGLRRSPGGGHGLTQILSKRVLHLRGKPDREVHALAI